MIQLNDIENNIIFYKLKKDFGTILTGTRFHLSGEERDHYRSDEGSSELFEFNLKLKKDFVENNTEWFEAITLDEVQKEFFESFMTYGQNAVRTIKSCQEAWMTFSGIKF